MSPADRARAEDLVRRTADIQAVTDEASFNRATVLAGEAKALLTEIDDSKKAAKKPFDAVEKAINKLAAEVALEIFNEHARILALLNAYVRKLEAERRAEEQRRAEAARREREAYEAKIREAQAAQRAAQLEAQRAQDEATRLRLQEEALKNQLLAEQQKLNQEMAEEVARIGDDQPRKGLVPGGRVDHPYTFRLISLAEVLAAHCENLLRWEIDVSACKNAIRIQLERNPQAKPVLPGIAIEQNVSVSIRATKR